MAAPHFGFSATPHVRLLRSRDWAKRLDTFLCANWNRRFQYGEWDCAIFVAEAIEATTGHNPATHWESLYGAYRNGVGARRMIRRLSGNTGLLGAAMNLCAEYYNMPEIAPEMAGRGDVVLVSNTERGGPLLALVGLTGLDLIATGATGLVRLGPREMASRAWRV